MAKYVFDHIHLRSPDPLKTAEFYEKMFGAKRISGQDNHDGRASAKLDLGGVTVLINQTREGQPAGLHHFGIRTENLEQAAEALKKQGVKFTTEPRQVRPDFKMSFVEAPEGVPIEVQEGQF